MCLGDQRGVQHLAEVQVAILEVVASDGAALIQHHVVPECHQLKVAHVQGVNVAPLPNARSLRTAPVPDQLLLQKTQHACSYRMAGMVGQDSTSWRSTRRRDDVLSGQVQELTSALNHHVKKGVPRKWSAMI